jgi:hypothetical protein
MISKLKYIIPVAMILVFSSCKKEFLNINTDPNNPTDAPIDLLLPTAQRTLGDALSMGGGTNGGLSQILEVYVHRITTREEADQYGALGNEFYTSLAWPKFYSSSPPPGESAPLNGILQNLEEIISKSTVDNNLYYRGIAKVMKAYTYSQLVDVFGDVPFSEANKLNDPTSPIIYPKFDAGSEIYPQLFTILDEAIADLATPAADAGPLQPEDDDVIYGGDPALWTKAANTIKLKLYNQIREVQDVSAQVTALLANPDGLIAATGEGFMLPYGSLGATDDRNPAFAEYFATQRSNHISPWFYEIMQGENNGILTGNPDPRVPYYIYNQLAADQPTREGNQTEYRDGPFVSIYFGSVGPDRDRTQQNSISVLGLYPAGGRYDEGDAIAVDATSATGAAPYRFITYADRLFIEAELIQVGVIAGDARAVLEDAITESFATVDAVVAMVSPSQSVPTLVDGGTPSAEVATYITNALTEFDAGSAEEKLQMIMTQKWIQSFGNAIEAYNDIRRTGYPVLFDPNNPAVAPGGFVQPPASGDPSQAVQKTVPVLLSRTYPLTLPWVDDELETNPNAPDQKTPQTFKPFWMP